MNRMFKVGISALAFAAASSAFAFSKSNEPIVNAVPEEEGVVGWTPFALGIASPVQLPWGLNRWDVFGLDINVLYSGAPKMYGIDVGGIAATTSDRMMGLQVSGLFNYGSKDVYGLRATLGANVCRETVYGLDAGLIGFHKGMYGFEAEFLGCYDMKLTGMQVGGLATIAREQSYGWTIAGLGNYADIAYGFQLAGLFNMTHELHGCQLALVNYAATCPWGFQIGLVNIIMDNAIKVLPFFNAYF